MLHNDQTFGFIVMDGSGTLFATLQGNSKNILNRYYVDLPKKHNKGGQSSQRFARLRMEKRQNYVTKVCELAVQCFIQNDKPKIEGLVLAGLGDFKHELQKSTNFDYRLANLVITLCDVSYGGENGLNQAIELCQDKLSQVKFIKEKKLISTFFDEVAQDTGMVVYGVEDTMKTIEAQAVKTVMCYENLDWVRLSFKDSEENEIFKYVRTADLENAEIMKTVCTHNDEELEIQETENLADYLAENYKELGIQLQLITDKSPEGFQFLNGFTGLGGFMRYKMELDHILNEPMEWADDSDSDFI